MEYEKYTLIADQEGFTVSINNSAHKISKPSHKVVEVFSSKSCFWGRKLIQDANLETLP